MVYWPEEGSVTTVPQKWIIDPAEASGLEVGARVVVKKYGMLNEGKVARRGE